MDTKCMSDLMNGLVWIAAILPAMPYVNCTFGQHGKKSCGRSAKGLCHANRMKRAQPHMWAATTRTNTIGTPCIDSLATAVQVPGF